MRLIPVPIFTPETHGRTARATFACLLTSRINVAVALFISTCGCAMGPVAHAKSASTPTARAGGPYVVTTGGSVVLNGAHSSSPAGSITTYEWDVNGDGSYRELKGAEPTLAASVFRMRPGDTTLALRVTDARGQSSTATAKLTVVASRIALHDPFRIDAASASGPLGIPAFGPDGRLYGTTQSGGSDRGGTLWRMAANGQEFLVLRRFDAWTDGSSPSGPVVGPEGKLYGASNLGGFHEAGTLWRVNLDGTGFEVLHHFEFGADGAAPQGAPKFGTDGRLYGVNSSGGRGGAGTVWRIDATGSGFVVLRHLEPADGAAPAGAPVVGPDGYLYGLANKGGANDSGTIWRLSADGAEFRVLKSLEDADGRNPRGSPRIGADGKLYGAAFSGGTHQGGTVWRMNRDGTGYTVLHHFQGASEGAHPSDAPVFGADGRLYGNAGRGAVDDPATVWRMKADGADFRVMGTSTDGVMPAGLVSGPDGRYYGVGVSDGSSPDFVHGVVWRIYPNGSGFEVVHSFGVRDNGALPYGPPVFGTNGRLYGTTFGGGAHDAGTLWHMKRDGTGFVVLHNFDAATEGGSSYGAIAAGSGDMLFGTNPAGGSRGYGTLWRIRRDGGAFTMLRHFESATDGAFPEGPPVCGSGGVLFGTTAAGGASNGGTVWRVQPDGTRFVVLRHFAAVSDGAHPAGEPELGSDGWLYGSNAEGGSAAAGTVWRVTQDGTQFAVLHHFTDAADGSFPTGSPVLGPDGRVYGSNALGGAHGFGTLWRMNRDGAGFTVLHHFENAGDTSSPMGSPIFGLDGRIYGVGSNAGGDPQGFGSLWRIKSDGTGFEVLEHFGTLKHGVYPQGGVRLGPDGRLYGSASGGADGLGTIYSWAEQ